MSKKGKIILISGPSGVGKKTIIDEISKNKTTLYITHRLASTQFCDKVVVLKEGSLEAVGSHFELLRNSQYYSELYNMQAEFYSEKKNQEDKKNVKGKDCNH